MITKYISEVEAATSLMYRWDQRKRVEKDLIGGECYEWIEDFNTCVQNLINCIYLQGKKES